MLLCFSLTHSDNFCFLLISGNTVINTMCVVATAIYLQDNLFTLDYSGRLESVCGCVFVCM